MRRFISWTLLVGSLCVAGQASAALTDSEKAQIQGFVRAGEVKNAARIRALVARPDLSASEAAEPLASGFGSVVFDEKREQLTREILLGPGSVASRNALTAPIVTALLARASAAMAAMPTLETGPEAQKADRLAAEQVRIHRFVTQVIANAGRPAIDGHDVAAGIRDDALKACIEAYRVYFERHARGLVGGPSLVAVRAQASLAVIDLSRGLLGRHEVSALLGLTGPRKLAFERHGVLIEDGGTASDERLAEVARFLDIAPRAASGLSLWLVNKAPARGLVAREAHASARVTLGKTAGAPTTRVLWADDVEPSRPDRELDEVAFSAAYFSTRAAFKEHPELLKVAERLAEQSARVGASALLSNDLPASFLPFPGASAGAMRLSPELYAVYALRLLMLDAPRAMELALARTIAGRSEPMAAFVLAASVLAATGGSADEVAVGRTEANGNVVADKLTNVKVNRGLVSAFELDGRKVELGVDADGQIEKVQVDGAAPRLSKLARVRLVPATGESWSVGSERWEKLGGAPQGLAVDDGRFVLGAAAASDGFDAVATGESRSDQTVHANIVIKKRGGGLLVRGQSGQKSYDAVALLISAEPTPKATLILVDGNAKATELAPGVELPAAGPEGYLAVLSVRGKKVSASVDGKKLEATLERGVGTGRTGVMVMAAGLVEVDGFGPGAPKPKKKAPKDKPAPKPKGQGKAATKDAGKAAPAPKKQP